MADVGSERNNSQPDDVCRDFLRNVCNRGKLCRFQHPPQWASGSSNTWNPLEERLNFSKSLCHDFQNVGCSREECKYVHCSKEDEEKFSDTGLLPANVLEDAIKKAVIPFLPRGIPVCRDYLNGECRRGKSCRFRHLSHCKYRKELDLLFGVQPQAESTVVSYPEAKRSKLSFTPGPTYSVDKPCAVSFHNCTQNPFLNENCNGHVQLPEQHHVYSLCQRTYAPESCCVQDSSSLHEENILLQKQVCELRRKVSDLLTANEFLLEQNATLRMIRKNGSVVTLQPPNVHSASGQQIVASVPVSIAPATGPGPMAISTMAMTAQPSTQQLVPVSCHAAGQQIMAAVSTVTVAGQTGSPALLATAVPVSVSSSASQLVPVSAVPVSLATVSMAPMHMPPIATVNSQAPTHSIAMSASAGTSLVSYPIMTQQMLQTR